MLHQRKYITNTIIPEENNEIRFGKKMFPENTAVCLKLDHINAGVQGERIGELNLNSRKQISFIKSDSSQMKNALNYSGEKQVDVYPTKKPLVTYSCYENQAKYFETKLVPDCHGKMSICVGRKSGSATVNMNVDDYDLEKTYHTWKKIVEKSQSHTRSNLENDRFLTVAEDAQRSDRLPIVKNRNPPVANADGPFESDRLNLPKHARDNLDRTLTPRANSNKYAHSKRVTCNYKNTFPISQPHAYASIDQIRGVKRNVSHWAHEDRVKKILYNYSDDTSEDIYGNEYEPNRNAPSKELPHFGSDKNSRNLSEACVQKQQIEEEQHHHTHPQQQYCMQQCCRYNNECNGNKESSCYDNSNGCDNKSFDNLNTQQTNSYVSNNCNPEHYCDASDNSYKNRTEHNFEANRTNDRNDMGTGAESNQRSTHSVNLTDHKNSHYQPHEENGYYRNNCY